VEETVKKSVVLAAVAAAAGFLGYRKMQAEQAEQDLWAEATDPVPPRDLR
jgi:hypothetical protein